MIRGAGETVGWTGIFSKMCAPTILSYLVRFSLVTSTREMTTNQAREQRTALGKGDKFRQIQILKDEDEYIARQSYERHHGPRTIRLRGHVSGL